MAGLLKELDLGVWLAVGDDFLNRVMAAT